MPEIFDVLAKVSWDTNTEELNKQLSEESKVLAELEQRGKRLETQMQKTNDHKKVAAVNQQLAQTKKAQDSIIEGQKKQLTATEELRKKQQQLAQQMLKTNDPKQLHGLIAQMTKLGNEIDKAGAKSNGLSAKLSGAGGSILAGIGLGAGTFGITAAVQGAMGILTDSLAEIEEAERAARGLGLALRSTGNERYFDGLIVEAGNLSKQYNNLFDNDEIVTAQTELVKYGKFTREELSKLSGTAIELASYYRITVPEAANKLIDVLAGRGASTLRDFGLTTKEAATEQERLGLVLGKLGEKVKGASDEFAAGSDGIRKQNELLIANTKEQIGEKLLPIYINVLQGINQVLEGEWKAIGLNFLEGINNLAKYTNPGGIAIEATKKLWKGILGTDDPAVKGDAVKGFKDFITSASTEAKKQAADKTKLNTGLSQEDIEAQRAAQKEAASKAAADRKAEAQRIKQEEAKKAAEIEALRKKLAANQMRLDEDMMSANDKARADITNNYDALLKEAKGNAELEAIIYRQKSQEIIQWAEKKAQRLKEIGIEVSATEKKNTEESVKDALRIAQSVSKQAEEKQKAYEEKKAQDEEDQRAARQQLYDEVLGAASVAQDLIAIEQQKNDKLIALQEDRVNAARGNSAASLKIEQDRLNELIAKRERFERTQRTIDAAVIAANQAVAISGAIATIANSKNPVLIAANVIAILAGIGATIAAIRSINAGAGFKEGGYTGDGDPSEESTAIGKRPYKYHKKEFVMDEGLTSKHRDMFEGLHKRNLVVQRMDDGSFYLAPDTHRMAEDFESTRESASLMPLLSEMSQMRKLLQQREVNISQNFDADGFGQAVAVQMGQINLKRKRA